MHRLRSFLFVVLAGGIASLGLLAGCDSASTDSAPGGTIRVHLTDAPLDDVAEARVTIERVELIGEGGTVLLSDEEQDFDLLELQNGLTAELAEEEVPFGRYSQIRLVVSEESELVFTDNTTEALKVPSGTQTGIKINLPTVDVESEDDLVEIVVDFDASRSFVKAGASGKYIFKPVIQAHTIEVNGLNLVEDVELHGTVTATGDEQVEVEGFVFRRIDRTYVQDGLDLSAGRRVALYAGEHEGDRIVLRVLGDAPTGEATLHAPIDQLAADALTLLGTSFRVTSETAFEGMAGLADLSLDSEVEVTFTYDAELDAYTATHVALAAGM